MRVDESNSVVDPYVSKIVRKGHLGWDEVVEDEVPCENVTLNTRYFYFRHGTATSLFCALDFLA